MRTSNSTRTLSPSESGRIYGKLIPSKKGKRKNIPSRAERRAILFPDKAERRRRIREVKDETKTPQ